MHFCVMFSIVSTFFFRKPFDTHYLLLFSDNTRVEKASVHPAKHTQKLVVGKYAAYCNNNNKKKVVTYKSECSSPHLRSYLQRPYKYYKLSSLFCFCYFLHQRKHDHCTLFLFVLSTALTVLLFFLFSLHSLIFS